MREERNKRIISRIASKVSVLILVIVWGVFAVPFRVQASERNVAIESCLIAGDQVVCQLKTNNIPSSDDGKFYIYANEVWQDGPTGAVVATVDAASSTAVSFPLNYNSAGSNLSRKFLVAVNRGGKPVQVSNEHYITNPEAIAAYTSNRRDGGIKGILPDGNKLHNGQLKELGVNQVIYNMPLDHICADSSVPGTIPFDYNGQTYYFNRDVIQGYDATVRHFNNQNLQVTMVILNQGTGSLGGQLVHPLARGGNCPGYALNVQDAEAVNHLKAIGAFLGQRYSGKKGNGQVDNWILGNEVNARTSWWYTSSTSLDVNVSLYVKAFRIFYNELKSNNANVRVYNSLDQEWNRKSNPGSFLSRDYLDRFNYYMVREGNIDWSLSFHPYNSPLYDPYAWNGPSMWVKKNLSTPYITMQNIELLIDYMRQPGFLNPAGQVRSISLAEIGYTSSFGSEAQEASIAYGYLKAASIPEIDAFMLFRQTDDAHEMKSYLAMGLTDLEGNKKPAYEIYRNLGTGREAQAKERASQIIGMDVDQMIREGIIWTREGSGVVKMP